MPLELLTLPLPQPEDPGVQQLHLCLVVVEGADCLVAEKDSLEIKTVSWKCLLTVIPRTM